MSVEVKIYLLSEKQKPRTESSNIPLIESSKAGKSRFEIRLTLTSSTLIGFQELDM